MQEGRYRRGCGHRVWKPEMEGELCALGKRTQQEEHERGDVERVSPDCVARGQYDIEIVASDNMPNDEDAREERQPAGRGDGQGHAGAVSRRLIMMPIADQQEGEDAGEFP